MTSTQEPVYISDAMSSAVGQELRHRVSFPVSRSDIRRWAIAIYFPEPPPAAFSCDDVVAPEEFNPFAWMVAEPEGELTGFKPGAASVEAELGLEEVGTDFMLNGGSEIIYGVPMCPGDVITSVTTLTGYDEREGRLGTMLFTRMTDTWTNQDDAHVKSTTTTLIRY